MPLCLLLNVPWVCEVISIICHYAFSDIHVSPSHLSPTTPTQKSTTASNTLSPNADAVKFAFPTPMENKSDDPAPAIPQRPQRPFHPNTKHSKKKPHKPGSRPGSAPMKVGTDPPIPTRPNKTSSGKSPRRTQRAPGMSHSDPNKRVGEVSRNGGEEVESPATSMTGNVSNPSSPVEEQSHGKSVDVASSPPVDSATKPLSPKSPVSPVEVNTKPPSPKSPVTVLAKPSSPQPKLQLHDQSREQSGQVSVSNQSDNQSPKPLQSPSSPPSTGSGASLEQAPGSGGAVADINIQKHLGVHRDMSRQQSSDHEEERDDVVRV